MEGSGLKYLDMKQVKERLSLFADRLDQYTDADRLRIDLLLDRYNQLKFIREFEFIPSKPFAEWEGKYS